MILHTVNKSIANSDSLSLCLNLATPGSGILLLEDGVYSALQNEVNLQFFADFMGKYKFYILSADLSARGISDRILPDFIPVSYAEFVVLSLEYTKLQNWD